MSDLYDDMLFHDDLPAGRREALREAAARDEDLARALRRWQAMQRVAREEVEAALPDRRLLVLHVLAEERPGALSEAERQEWEAARPALHEALRAHPALADVARDVRRAAEAFEAAWDEAAWDEEIEKVEEAARPARSEPAPARADRPARAPEPRAPARRPLRRWAWRVAAGAALVVFAAVALFILQRDAARVTVTVADGALRTVTLADGSTVRLAGPAQLTYTDPERGAALGRHVRLERGRAYFDVQPGRRAFVVETPAARATALGTRFGVQAAEATTEVVLVAGEVVLAPRAAPERGVVLAPGQRSRVAAGAQPTTPQAVDLTEALRWSGLLVFRNAPLGAVAARLQQHYGGSIRVAEALRAEQVTGTFGQEQPLEEVLRTLAATLGAELRRQEGAYALAPARAAP